MYDMLQLNKQDNLPISCDFLQLLFISLCEQVLSLFKTYTPGRTYLGNQIRRS